MDPYTTYMSAVHAACCVIQMYQGVEAGLAFSLCSLDSGPYDGDCDAISMAEMLRDEGLSTTWHSIRPSAVPRLIEECLDQGRIALFQVKAVPPFSGKRWALSQGMNTREVAYVVCVGEDEGAPKQNPFCDMTTGEVVTMDYPCWRTGIVVARVAPEEINQN